MAINKVEYGNTTLIDLTDTTATASDVASGKYFYTASGVKTEGTASGGGGGGGVEQKQVNFIDYDGTILYSYTKAEANALSALPANPSHTGLTAQGWNWTLAQIKAQLTACPNGAVWVGQMYNPASGKTEIDIILQSGHLTPYLSICVNGSISVDWGDGSSTDTITGTSLTTLKYQQHTYAVAGEYTILISVNSGNYSFMSTDGYPGVLRRGNSNLRSTEYSSRILAIRLADIANIGNYAFYGCYSLYYVTIHKTLLSIGNSAFYRCSSLRCAIIPSNVTSLTSTFSYCTSIKYVSVPAGLTFANGVFSNCYYLKSATIPCNLTTLNANLFNSCFSLSHIELPNSITSIGTTNENYVFGTCYSLTSMSVPSGVTYIGSYAFSTCYGITEYHLLPTSPPTLQSTSFYNIQSYTVIYVPRSENQTVLNAYKTAQNWSTHASKMQEEPQ